MKRKLFSFFASVITAIMLTACAAAPEDKPASSATLSPPSEAVATAIPSTSNANWKLPPQYDFDEMIPLFSRETHTAGYAAARNLYAVRKGERWSLFNALPTVMLFWKICQKASRTCMVSRSSPLG